MNVNHSENFPGRRGGPGMGFGFSHDGPRHDGPRGEGRRGEGRRGEGRRGEMRGRDWQGGEPLDGGSRGAGPDGRGPHAGGPHAGGPHAGGPRGGGPRGGHRGGGRGRAQRGDIRTATFLLLAEEPMHGYQIMQAIATRTDGAWRPSPGAIYPTIAQLEDEGLIIITREGGRKLATLTESGRQHVEDHAATMGNPFGSMTRGSAGSHDLRGAIEDVQTATRIVAKGGSADQIAAVHQILAQARKSIYLILADGPAAETDEASATDSE